MKDYSYTIMDINQDMGIIRVYDHNERKYTCVSINSLKQLYEKGIRIGNIAEDKLEKLKKFGIGDSYEPCEAVEKSNEAFEKPTEAVEKPCNNFCILARDIYNIIPSDIKCDKSKEDIAKTIVNYVNDFNKCTKSALKVFNMHGVYGVMWSTKFNIPNNAPARLLLVASVSFCRNGNSDNYTANTNFHIVDAKNNRVMYTDNLDKKPKDMIEEIKDIVYGYMTNSEIDNSVSGKKVRLNLNEQEFKGRYSWENDTLLNTIDRAFKLYTMSDLPDVRILSMYLMELIYEYDGSCIKLDTIKAFSDNLHIGIEWSMQLESGKVVNCRIESPIINTKCVMLRYTDSEKAVASDIGVLEHLIECKHRASYVRHTVCDINSRMLNTLLGIKDYCIKESTDVKFVAKLSKELEGQTGNICDAGVYEIVLRMKNELNGSLKRINVADKSINIITMLCRKEVNVNISSRVYSPEIKTITVKYCVGDSQLYENIIKVNASDRRPFSKLDMLKEYKLDEIVKVINRDIDTIVKPQLIYMN